MDKKQRLNYYNNLVSLYKDDLLRRDIKDSKVKIKESDTSVVKEVLRIFEERHKQRKVMFIFLVVLTIAITLAFFGLLSMKIYLKYKYNIDIVGDDLLKVIAVSFFVELAVTVRAIVTALWDEKGFLSTPLLTVLAKKKQ